MIASLMRPTAKRLTTIWCTDMYLLLCLTVVGVCNDKDEIYRVETGWVKI